MILDEGTKTSPRWYTLGYAIAITFLTANFIYTSYNLIWTELTANVASTSRETVEALDDVLSILKDAETGQRGYLLTGDEAYLQPYHRAVASAPASISHLRSLTAGNDALRPHFADVAEACFAKLAELDRAIDLRRHQGFDAAVAQIKTDEGKILMDRIRQDIAAMRTTESATRLDLREQRRATLRQTLITFTLTSGLALGLLFGVHAVSERSRRRSQRYAAWLSTTLASIGDAVIATDESGAITFMNAVAEELCGWTLTEASGRPLDSVFVIINEETRAPAPSPVEKVFMTGKIQGLANHTLLIAKDGTERVIEDSAAPILGENGRITGVVLVFHDATEKRRAEVAVTRSEERLRAMVTASTDVMYVMTADWSEMLPIDGRTLVASNDVPLRNWLQQNLPPSEHDLIREEIRQAIAEKRMFDLEHRLYRPDRSIAWTHSRAVPMLAANGDIIEWFGMASDVTRRKQAEEEKQRLEAEAERQRRIYEAALSNTPDLVYVFGLDHRFLYANEALLRMWGRTRQDSIGKTCLELGYEPWHAQMHDREIDQVVATGRPIRGEVPFTGTNGRRIYDYIFAPVVGGDGNVVAVAGTTRDVTERQQAEQAIRDQAEQLRENDRRKDEFLAMLAHELRNPLAAISSGVLLVKTIKKPEVLDQIKDMIDRQTKHLTRLIDDLLDVSRIATGKVTLKKETVELGMIIARAIDQVRPLIEEKRHELTISVPERPVRFVADPTRTAQIIGNLLTNAAKYTPHAGRIQIESTVNEEEIAVKISDTGVGIPPEMLPKVFGLFTQIDSSIERSQGGLGIGLTLVSSLVEMHGGRVSAASEGEGKGSEFSFSLPIGQPSIDAMEATNPEPIRPSRSVRRILIVDDNLDTAKMTARLLTYHGFEVQTAYDGHEGIEAARRFQPHIILLDIGLPGMNGYEVAAALGQEDGCRDALIIGVSGYGEAAARDKARQAGFHYHLTKPLDFDKLDDILRQLPG